MFPPAVTKVSSKISSSLLHRRSSELNDLPRMTDEAPLSIIAILGRLLSTSSHKCGHGISFVGVDLTLPVTIKFF